MNKNKKSKEDKANLKGFEMKLNQYGELVSSHQLDEVNAYLDKNVADKKLAHLTEEE